MATDDKYQQLFVIGAPRSGTTFLSELLRDTRYGEPLESHFITKYYDRLPQYGDLGNKSSLNKLINAISRERPVMQWNINIDADELHKQLESKITYSEIVDYICLKRQPPNTCAWGDKTPHYTARIDTLYELFPNAKFVYIVRDGRDVAMSLLKKSWGPNNMYSCAELWKHQNTDNHLFKSLERKGQLMTIKYEELLDAPNEYIDSVYSFLGEQISEDRRTELCSSTLHNNAFKWKRTMTPKQIKIFESVAGETLSRLGYETTDQDSRISIFERTFFRAHNFIIKAKSLFVLNVVDGFKIRYMGAAPFDQ